MATTTVTITNAAFTYEDGAIKASGNLNVNAEKLITSIFGSVTESGANIGSFSANRDTPESQGNLRYNVSYDDPTKAETLIQTAPAAVAAVQAKLNE